MEKGILVASDEITIVIYFFDLGFNIPVNNFSVMWGQSHRFLVIIQYSGELMCLA